MNGQQTHQNGVRGTKNKSFQRVTPYGYRYVHQYVYVVLYVTVPCTRTSIIRTRNKDHDDFFLLLLLTAVRTSSGLTAVLGGCLWSINWYYGPDTRVMFAQSCVRSGRRRPPRATVTKLSVGAVDVDSVYTYVDIMDVRQLNYVYFFFFLTVSTYIEY